MSLSSIMDIDVAVAWAEYGKEDNGTHTSSCGLLMWRTPPLRIANLFRSTLHVWPRTLNGKMSYAFNILYGRFF